MKIGTKSVLFGAHCFFIHPFFVAYAWYKLYGFPTDPRLWIAFFVHDIGYIGKPNMDGEEGEKHPYTGAKIMDFLFGTRWYHFTLFHSRFLSKKLGVSYSKLCVADKLAFAIMPSWIYLPMVNLTGEIHEYLLNANITTQKEWFKRATDHSRKWAYEHKYLKVDEWTQIRNYDDVPNIDNLKKVILDAGKRNKKRMRRISVSFDMDWKYFVILPTIAFNLHSGLPTIEFEWLFFGLYIDRI